MEPPDTDPPAVADKRPATPGEVVPPGRRILDRAPSERYATATAADASDPLTGSLPRAAVGAILPAAIGAAILVLLAAPLALVEPLVVVAVLLGVVAGLGARWGGGTATPRSRRRAVAVVVAVLAVAVAEFIVWRLALAEGGVLSMIDYEAQVFGPIAVLQPVAAALASWASA